MLSSDKKYDEAIEEYEKVSFNDTSYSAAQLEVANCYFNKEDFKMVQQTLLDLIDLNLAYSRNHIVYKMLGLAFEKDKNLEKCLEYYNKGLELFPNHYGFYANRAIAYQNANQYENAIKDFKKAILMNPSTPGNHFHLGMYAAHEGHYSEAIISLSTYLLLEYNTERSATALGTLEQLCDLTFEPKSKKIVWDEESDFFEKLNVAILDKTSTKKDNKIKFSLPSAIGNQFYYILSTSKYQKDNFGFWNQFYMRFYSDLYTKEHLNGLVLSLLRASQDETIYKKLRKKIKILNQFMSYAEKSWVLQTEHQYLEFEGVKQHVLVGYGLNGFEAIGKSDSLNVPIGTWYYYHPNGTLSLKAEYDEEGVSNGLWTWYNLTNSKIQSTVRYKDGKADGDAHYFYYSGELSVKKSFKDDKEDGNVFCYYRSGDLSETYSFKNGLKDGPVIGYHENGQKSYVYSYKDGIANGYYKEYFPNSVLYVEFNLVDDKIDGVRKEYFSTGTIKSETNYKLDVLNGVTKTYYSNGKLESDKIFKEGKQVGAFVEYFSNGTISFNGELDESGKENGTSTSYDLDGKKFQEQDFKKGELIEIRSINKKGEIFNKCKKKGNEVDYKSYYADGGICSEGLYLNDVRSGKWTFYDRYENIETIEIYENGLLVDSALTFHPNGKLKIKAHYDADILYGMYLKYNIQDTLIEEGFYRDDLLDKDWYTYNSDGKLVGEYYYVAGNENGIQNSYGVNGKMTDWREIELGKVISQIYLDTNESKIDQFSQFHGEVSFHNALNTFVRFKSNFKNGLANGFSYWYTPSGKVVAEGNYINDKRDSVWKWYYDNGKLEKIATYSFGLENGTSKSYYPDGTLMAEETFFLDKKQGVFKRYYENGVLEHETNFIEDERHGKSVDYDREGNIIIIRYFDNGIFVAYSYLDKDGNEITPIKLSKEKDLVITYYKNGTKASEHNRLNGYVDGRYISYSFNGKILTDENYIYGVFNGPYKEFDKDGNLELESNYKLDGLHGICKTYYPNGKVKKEENYLYGQKHGNTNHYSIDGKLTQTDVFYNDELIDFRMMK